MKKRMLSMFLVVVMLLGMVPGVYASGDTQTVLDVSQGNIVIGEGTVDGYAPDGTHVTTPDPEGYIITGSSTEDAKKLFITGGEQTITFRDLSIDVSAVDDAPAVNVDGDHVKLTLEGTNVLRSGSSCAGLCLNGSAALTITAASTGSLDAYGGDRAPGIGSRYGGSTGDITIHGGIIRATGEADGSAIGSAAYASCGNITITGGTIQANTELQAACIGAGGAGQCGNITITGGSISAALTVVGDAIIGATRPEKCGTITITGGQFAGGDAVNHTVYGAAVASGYGVAHLSEGEYPYQVRPFDGTVTFHPNGGTGEMAPVSTVSGSYTTPKCTFTPPEGQMFEGWATEADGAVLSGTVIEVPTGNTDLYAIWKDVPQSDISRTVLDVSRGNITLGDGTVDGYAPDGTHITTPDPDGYIITGSSTEDSKKVLISSGDHKITFRDLSIDVARVQYAAAFNVDGGHQEVTLEGTNVLKSGRDYSGLNLNGTASLTITAESTGSLTAVGGSDGAGIGSRMNNSCGDITILGGQINATGGYDGSGIGTSWSGSCGNITISGGQIIATGTNHGSAIGVSYNGSCGTITITGGRFAQGDVDANTVYGIAVAEGAVVTDLGEGDCPYQVLSPHTVTFDPNGGTGEMAPVEAMGDYTLPSCGFTAPEGKQFKGWATSADGAVLTGSIQMTEAITLYAIWEKKPDMHDHGDHEGWVLWDDPDSLPYKPGYYCLTVDVAVADMWHPKNGTVLCLNGHDITKAGEEVHRVVYLDNMVTFYLFDCNTTRIRYGHWDENDVYQVQAQKGRSNASYYDTITGGIIRGGNDGSIDASEGSTFYMYGGTLAGNTAVYDGLGVKNNGTFYMYGGLMCGNDVRTEDTNGDYGRGTVFNNGIFHMYGGKISNNKAVHGGGVYVDDRTDFFLHDGEISYNASTTGGGVWSDGRITMEGGKIAHNTAEMNGGGIYAYRSENSSAAEITRYLRISGGEISHNTSATGGGGVSFGGNSKKDFVLLQLSGSVKIANNTVSGTTNNLLMLEGEQLDVPAPLTGEAAIGVTLADDHNLGGVFALSGSAYAGSFSSDHSDYRVVTEGEGLKLVRHSLTHHQAVAATCTATGTVEYWSCSLCGLNFSDEGVTQLDDTTAPIAPINHTGSLQWTKTATTHKQFYSCCNAVAVEEEAHAWTDGLCTQCGYGCEHTPEDDDGDCTTAIICSNCGVVTTQAQSEHSFTDDYDTSCNTDGCTHTRSVSYNLWVSGNEVTSSNLSGENWSYDVTTNILTFTGTGDVTVPSATSGDTAGYAVYARQGLTIALDGASSYTFEGIHVSGNMVTVQNVGSIQPDLTITDGTGYFIVEGSCTITGMDDVTIIGAISGPPAIDGSLSVDCSGDLSVTNDLAVNCADLLSGPLTVTKAANVTISATPNGSLFNGATITASGDVTITGGAGMVSSNSVIFSGKNISITSKTDIPLIGSGGTIAATGRVEITNQGGGMISGGEITISGADVAVNGNTISGPMFDFSTITATGNVDVTNNSTGMAFGSDTSITGKDVTISGKTSGSTPLVGGSDNNVITATGDVTITNNGTGMVFGSGATIDGVNISISGAASNTPLVGDDLVVTAQGTLTITNDPSAACVLLVNGILTVNKATDVTLSAAALSTLVGSICTINAAGDVVMTNSGAGAVCSSSADISANHVTISAQTSGSPILMGNAAINAAGNVNIENRGGMIFNYDSVITGADVSITANSASPMVGSGCTIDATGDVVAANSGTGMVFSATATIEGKTITVTGNCSNPAVGGSASFTATDDVTVTNSGTGMAFGNNATITGEDVTISATSATPMIGGLAVITASGNVELVNDGTGMLCGSTAAIQGANITLTGSTDNAPLIPATATITATGDVEVTNSGTHMLFGDASAVQGVNVTLTGNTSSSNPSMFNAGCDITAAGELLVVNHNALDGVLTPYLSFQSGSGTPITYGGTPCVNIKHTDDKMRLMVSPNADGSNAVAWDGTDPAGFRYLRVEKAIYSVTMSSDGNGSAMATPAFATEGTLITLAAFPKEGYHFSHWEVPQDVTVSEENTFSMPAHNVTVTAIFAPHAYTYTSNGDSTHTGTCTCGAVTQPAPCSGTATCTDLALCEVCQTTHGQLDQDAHTGTEVWKQTATQHHKEYTCCGAVTLEQEDHTFENGVCTQCGHICQHTGGEATCTAQAVCTICDSAYGALNPDNHASREFTYISNGSDDHQKHHKCCNVVVDANEAHHKVSTVNGDVCTLCGQNLHTHTLRIKPGQTTTDQGHILECLDAACDYETVEAHSFDQYSIKESAKVHDANCTEPAVYYVSCPCGHNGTETFPVGQAKGHDFANGEWVTDSKDHWKECANCDAQDTDNKTPHSYTWISNGDGTHTGTCVCGSSSTGICAGGEATCIDKALCRTCGGEHGELKADHHASDVCTYTDNLDGETHTVAHKCCEAVLDQAQAHTYVDGQCVCGAVEQECVEIELEVGETAVVTQNGLSAPMSEADITVKDDSIVSVTMEITKKSSGWGFWNCKTTYDHTITFEGLSEGTTVVQVGEVYYRVTVTEAHEHSYIGAITKPTCTDKGYTTYTCECGHSYVADYVDPLGHEYEDGVCWKCGEEEVTDFTPDRFAASISSSSVTVGKSVTITVKTSADVAYITVNGELVDDYTENGDLRTFTYLVRENAAGSYQYQIYAYNADDVQSTTSKTLKLTVKTSSWGWSWWK